jgi:hypothetical protein
VWRDPELHGNEDFAEVLCEQLRKVAALVPIVSPGYVNSTWGRRELDEFCRAAQDTGGLQIGHAARVFKVLKTLVPLDQHPLELRPFLGYEFYRVDETGRVHEFSEIFGPEARQEFLLKLDDLARDLSSLLRLLQDRSKAAEPTKGGIFIAETTSELKTYRDALRRGFTPEGYAVLPSRTVSLTETDIETAAHADLAECCMSVHIFGSTYGLVPEGAELSLPEIQLELAGERMKAGAFSRIVWIPAGLSVTDDRQRRLLDRLRTDERMRTESELLEMSFEDARTVLAAKLKERERRPKPKPVQDPNRAVPSVYLVCDQRDQAALAPWDDLLFQSCEVIRPLFDGDEREVREAHEDALRTCDGVVLLYGAGSELWLRRKLTDVQKSPGIGRTKPLPEVCICLAQPRTPAKEQCRTHFARVIPQWDGCDGQALQPFLDVLATRVKEPAT